MMIAQVQMLARISPTITALDDDVGLEEQGDRRKAAARHFQMSSRLSFLVAGRWNRSTQARGCRLGRPSGVMNAAVTMASARISSPRMTR